MTVHGTSNAALWNSAAEQAQRDDEPMERDWGFVRPFLFGFAVASWIILLSGCSLVTLPVKATSKAVDWSTTSRNEADRNRGREMRKQDEAYARCMRERAGNC